MCIWEVASSSLGICSSAKPTDLWCLGIIFPQSKKKKIPESIWGILVLLQVSSYSFLILFSGLTFCILWLIAFCSPLKKVLVCGATLHTLSDIEKLLWMPHATEVAAKLEFLTHRYENRNKIIITKHWDLGRVLFYKKIIAKIELKHNPLLQVNCLH